MAATVPTMYALGLWLGGDIVGLFTSFGTFACLGFADFGGPPLARARAYALLVAAGAAIIVAGTLASLAVVPAVLTVAVLGFAIEFVAVFGGYWSAASRALLVVLVLAVLVGDSVTGLDDRLVGWVAAGAASTVVALVVLPAHERRRFRARTAEVCDLLAEAVEAADPGAAGEAVTRAHTLVTDVRAAYLATPLRPAGPTDRDQAIVRLIDALGYATERARHAVELGDGQPGSPFGAPPLRAALATTLARSATALHGDGPAGSAPAGLREALAALDRARATERAQFETPVAGDAPEPSDAAVRVADLDRAFPARVLSLMALDVGANALVVAGAGIDPETLTPLVVARPTIAPRQRARRLVATHLSLRSACCRASIRMGLALAAAVAIARNVDVAHPFWVALGVLVVLRSSAPSTAVTALDALAGTLVGFALVALITATVGDELWALWPVLVIAVFLAAYTPVAVHREALQLVGGQAAFTLFVVALFNILEPAGWHTGLVRLEDVAIGASVGIGVGLLVWPRGARTALRRALADHLGSVATYVEGAYGALVGARPARDAAALHRAVIDARRRTDDAYGQALAERHAHGRELATSTRLTGLAITAELGGQIVWAAPETMATPPPGGPAAQALAGDARTVVGELEALARGLTDPATAQANTGPDAEVGSAVFRAAARELAGTGATPLEPPLEPQALLALVWSSDWLRVLDHRAAVLRRPAAELGVALDRPWWR